MDLISFEISPIDYTEFTYSPCFWTESIFTPLLSVIICDFLKNLKQSTIWENKTWRRYHRILPQEKHKFQEGNTFWIANMKCWGIFHSFFTMKLFASVSLYSYFLFFPSHNSKQCSQTRFLPQLSFHIVVPKYAWNME